MGLFKLIVDRWGPLNYKRAFADPVYKTPDREAFPGAMRTWVPTEDRRRLASYTLFAAYCHNQAWEVDALQNGAEARLRREFGDPAMLVASLTSHMLGREQTITVDGSEDADPADGSTPDPEAVHAAAVQDRLRTWARQELFSLRMQQNERKAVREGDGVYTLAWDGQKMRPRLSVVDPGFYFPDLPDNAGDSADYPTRVHFAWEVEPDPKIKGGKTKLRRITYELAPIGTRTISDPGEDGSRPFRTPALADDGSTPLITAGDLYQPDTGQIVRQYPWNDAPTYLTCYLTDAEWDLDDIKADQDVHTLDERYATYLVGPDGEVLDHLDLWQDYIPVVHLPNTIPEDGHWGESSLAMLMQLFDELAGTDRDSALASASTGNPILGIVNGGEKTSSRRSEPQQRKIRPGMAIELAQGGNIITVDTSPQLAELRNKTSELQDRLSLIARMPAVALGTLDPTKAPSGFSIELSYGPMDPLMDSMHLARDHKYELLFKMVQRLYLAGQHPDWTGPVVNARLAWGSYKPTDKAATLTMVQDAVDKGVMSLETGVRMLMEVGLPIDDVSEEIERIQSRQFAKARDLADATGDTTAVGNFLGLDVNPDPEPPAPTLPPTPTEPAPQDPQGSGGNTQ
ncbi:Bacteriophage portal protein, SPP1 Gp6-like protein [Actinobacteria bacterium OV320]|nr:Bacteriophage portal protein, SPP1 Gp6-like protein [Actinobacteria bacterium OV320]